MTATKGLPKGLVDSGGLIGLPKHLDHRNHIYFDVHIRVRQVGQRYAGCGRSGRHKVGKARMQVTLPEGLNRAPCAAVAAPRAQHHRAGAGAGGLGLPVDGEEELDLAKVRLERIWLGLRTRRGISLQDLPVSATDRVRSWEENALAVVEGNVVRLTPMGWLVMDRLTVELDEIMGG